MSGQISVVIPLRDGAAHVREALDSVLGQTLPPHQVIVVDDGSTDGGPSIVQALTPEVTLIRQPHRGSADARNTGLALADREFLAFLDADDLFVPDKLEWQVATLQDQENGQAIFGQVEEFVSPETPAAARSLLRAPHSARRARALGSMLIRREAFDRVGPFREGSGRGDALDWFARADEVGLRQLHEPRLALRRRLHAANTGLRELGKEREYVRTMKAALDRRRETTARPTE
jgi:glycosyltransferase involved in cell wall biosynthesis